MTKEYEYIGSPDNPRTTAVVCYITFIGWLIAFFALFPSHKTSLSAFHLRQAALLHILSFILKAVYSFLPFTTAMLITVAILVLILIIAALRAMTDALNGKEKPLPLIGPLAQSLFYKLGR